MKQILLIILACAAMISFNACSDSDYTDRYPDPSKTSNVSCEKLMTGIFQAGNTYTLSSYYRYFTFETQQIGKFAQTMGFTNEKGMYLGMGESYNNDRWKNFYNVLTQYRLLEYTYNNLPEDEKSDYEVFVLLSTIYLYDHLQQIVDLWGNVPFSEAGYLAITGDVANSYPSYETAESIYETMLDELQNINTKLASMTNLSTLTSTYLTTQDYINGGDLSLWRKYANSLRLRMALRVSENGSLTSKGKSVINEILSDPSTYPVIENNNENTIIQTAGYGIDFKVLDEIREGFESWAGQCNRASATMVTNLTGDPRLDIIYDKNGSGQYIGMNTTETEAEQTINFNKGDYYSAVDTATFSRNEEMPGVIMTAAEVDFIKAEAFQKGYASGDAKAAFEAGVKHSIELYYEINATATYRTPTTAPSNTEIAAFAASKWDAYPSKEIAIGTQKWLHFSLLQMVQAWSDIRRTDIPALFFQVDNATADCPNVPDRLRYPTDEKNSNPIKYAEVQANDTYYNKLFWAK